MCAPEPSMAMHAAPKPARASRAQHSQRGLSIIELMVGIVVALFVSLAATSSAVMFTNSQRQGIGTGGSIVNASTALASIKSDASLAGLGFYNGATMLCPNLNLSVGASVKSDNATFTPVQVLHQPSSDQLDVIYGSIIESGTMAQLQAASDGTSAELITLLPAAVGQVAMLVPSTDDVGGPCTVRSVTAVAPSTATTPQVITFGNSGSYNSGVFASTPAYSSDARITLLGDLRFNRYRIDAGNLVLEHPMDGGSAVLVRNVMGFRVQYGITTGGVSTTLDDWVDPSGAWATLTPLTIGRVRAMRIGIMVRSPQIERRDGGGNCIATETAPQLFGETPAALTTGDWACYRYRVSTMVVPLRNLVLP